MVLSRDYGDRVLLWRENVCKISTKSNIRVRVRILFKLRKFSEGNTIKVHTYSYYTNAYIYILHYIHWPQQVKMNNRLKKKKKEPKEDRLSVRSYRYNIKKRSLLES